MSSGMNLRLSNYTSAICEVFIDLLVQLVAVGYDNKTPSARYLSQHFLCEEDHRDTLSGALRMPERRRVCPDSILSPPRLE